MGDLRAALAPTAAQSIAAQNLAELDEVEEMLGSAMVTVMRALHQELDGLRDLSNK